ncbi:MAG: hypothetical protein NVS9B13_20400 [Candidatus Acidiferrum sp.]
MKNSLKKIHRDSLKIPDFAGCPTNKAASTRTSQARFSGYVNFLGAGDILPGQKVAMY